MTLDFSGHELTAPPLELEVDEPLTQLSSNSKAAVLHEIQRQERVHWFLGLRQAELTIRDKLSVLQVNRAQERRALRQMRGNKREYEALQAKGIAVEASQLERMEEIEDDFVMAKQSWLDLRPLIRDAEMELEAARSEKERLLAQHPEALELTFSQLQDQYASVALFEKQAWYFAAEAWSAVNHLPPTVGHMLFDMPLQQREHLMLREAEIRCNVSVDETTVQAARRIASLPAASQERIVDALMSAETTN